MSGRSLLALLVGGLLLTACGVPDRRDEVQVVTDRVETLPGVEGAQGSYSNDYTQGYSYRLRVSLAPGATAEQARTVVDTYGELIGRDGLAGHDLRLDLQLADDSAVVHAFDGSPLDAGPAVDVWTTLAWSVPGAVEVTYVPHSPLDIRITADDLLAALDVAGAAGVDDAAWIVQTEGLILRTDGASPRHEAMAAIVGLAGPGSDWDLTLDPTAEPALQAWSREDSTDDLTTVRSALDQLRELPVPVLYTLDLPAGRVVEVLVGGCLPGGDDLQQQLNAEYGTC